MPWVFWFLDVVEIGVRRLARFARRRPVVAIPAVAVAIMLVPLLYDAYGAIPWYVKTLVGYANFAAIAGLGLRRIWLVEPKDDAVPVAVPRGSRLAPFVVPILLVAMAVPFLAHPENLGAGDWDLFLSRFESIRRSIVEYGEFPWWDPWCRAGFPLAASPHCGVVGVATPFVLIFGTSVGLRVAALACIGIASEGARRLARVWVGDPWASVAAALIYGMNGGVILQTVAGYHLPMSFCAFPWLLVCMFRLERSAWYGASLGFWMAFNVLNGINYFSVYGVMIAVVVGMRALRARSGVLRSRFFAHAMLAFGVMLAMSGWRLATMGSVIRDFPRPYHSGWDETPVSILTHLLHRPPVTMARSDRVYFWETTCYIGPVVFAIAVMSLFYGWRWWHTMIAVCAALAVGTLSWYHASYWLSGLPVFSSMHVATRWRIMAMLGVGMAAADVLSRWRRSGSRVWRAVAVVALAAIAADYTVLGIHVLPEAFRIAPEESRFPGPAVDPIVQVFDHDGFPSVLRGYGVMNAQEPLLGYNQYALTNRSAQGFDTYQGEAWTDDGPIAPESWSPNRITFRAHPHQILFLNQNPGSWWWANDARAFPDARCAETLRDFQTQADARGRLVLEIRPVGLRLGMILHAVGAGIVLVMLAMRKVQARSHHGPPTTGA